MSSRFCTSLFASALALGGCAAPALDDEPSLATESIIGGVAANARSLDAVGSLSVLGGGDPQPFCSATLIGPETILTAAHCAELFETREAGDVYFGIGPDGFAPRRLVRVVASTAIPRGSDFGFVGYQRDVAILHLEEPVRDVVPAVPSALPAGAEGSAFGVTGFGVRDVGGNAGVRRAGTMLLRGAEGPILPLMFGSFESFLDYYVENFASSQTGLVPPIASPLEEPPGAPLDGTVELDPEIEEALRAWWDEPLIPGGYEAYLGGQPGDVQPCYGDSGGPLLRSSGGRLQVFGVASGVMRSRTLLCDRGAVYATLGPELLPIASAARSWTDPCGDLTEAGVCRGDEAVRCTTRDEGPRRAVRTDCSLLGLACGAGDDGQVACVEPSACGAH